MSEMNPQDGQQKPEQGAVSPPKPLRKSRWRIARKTAVWVAAGGCVVVLVGSMITPCMGALRSTQLKWEERRKEADAAVAESDAAEAREVASQGGK